VEVSTKNIRYLFIEGQTSFSMSRGDKLSSALMNRSWLYSIQIQTLPPRMHLKWVLFIDNVCKTTSGKSQGRDQLLTQSPIELEDNSIDREVIHWVG
jgi:hypothetical protein